MKPLFLSHNPHEVHLNFAKSINAKIKIIPFDNYVKLIKKYHFLSYFYQFISLIYSLSLKINQEVLFVDGGSALYVASFLKKRKKSLKIIYLDADLLFYELTKKNKIIKKFLGIWIKDIDAVLSISEQNKKYITKFVKKPIELIYPYPQEIKKQEIKRENYGLYVGRLDQDKNIKRILNFGAQCPSFDKFLIIGDGTEKDYIKKISSKNNKITYLGKKENIEDYYSKCKFLIHLPDSDPHPCTTMEAAICGCYPIISKGTGTNYLFDNLFIINNPNDFNEINNKIRYILKHSKKAEKSLKKSIPKIPTKEKALNNFKTKFEKILKQLK